MAATPAAREASVIVLDVSSPMVASFGVAKSLCATLIQQKLVLSPRDVVGIVFGGTPGALNRLNAASPTDYMHLTVARPVMSPNADFIKAIDAATLSAPAVNFDMLDGILVGADLIHEAVGDKKFSRRIFLVSSCAGVVQKKDKLQAIIDGLKSRGIALVVIGVDFDEDVDPHVEVDWARLNPKQQNERVLHFVCGQLGGDSIVIAVHDAVSAVSALRKRHVAQRAYCKCVLDVGDVRIPVTMFTKCLESRIPSFGKITTKGEGIAIERRYFSVRKPDEELDPTQRIKAYRYGRSAIPVNDVDEAAMKFKSERCISLLGFVPEDQVPLHVLQGGTKVLTPVPGDSLGAKALSGFVQAMAELKRAMLVRFTRCTNAAPTLGVCFASSKADKDVLYFVGLPFAEDLRRYAFPSLKDVHGTPEERTAIAALVDAMDLDRFEKSGGARSAGPTPASTAPSPAPAAPLPGSSASAGGTVTSDCSDSSTDPSSGRLLTMKETFNPALQHYYHAVKERYLRPDAPMVPMPPQVARTATAWGQPGNVLAPFLATSATERKRVRDLLPPPAPKSADSVAKGKTFWFHKAADVLVPDSKKGPMSEVYHSGTTPGVTTGGTGTPTSLTPDAVRDALRVSADITSAAGLHVTTIDPVGTFMALVDKPGEDHVARAVHEMQEAILQLLRVSIGAQYYSRCGAALRALRQVSIREGEPQAFNNFLLHLLLITKSEAHHQFWDEDVVRAGILPISKSECPESDVLDHEARTFLEARAPPARPLLDDAPDEPSLFDELE